MSEQTFGQRFAATSAADLAELERSEGRSERFSAIDTALTGLAMRCARGDRVVRMVRADRLDRVEIVGVPDELRSAMADAFRLESQQSRGAWFLPDAVAIKAALVTYPSHFREYPRYAHTLAHDERGKVALKGSPDAMVLWSALEPMFDELLRVIALRSDLAGTLSRGDFFAEWYPIEAAASDLGLELRETLGAFRWGGGWSRFSPDEQLAAKRALLVAIADQMSVDVVRRFRLRATRSLVVQYYSKAKNGRAKRRQVISKNHWRSLAGFFAGDWLAFVDYLGEQPHDEERVVTALPETKIMVSGKERAAALAAKKGLPVEEVERMLGAYWDAAGGESPVLQRAAVLSRYWKEFDAVHARQAPGMPSLWGLVQEGGWGEFEPQSPTPYQPSLFRRLLSAEVVAEIERLWGTTVLPKWPDRIVSEPFPHAAMSEAFGPALKFWHGCALTAWFVCEGPTSRTDIRGIAHYYRRELAELAEIGCGVHPQLFEELNAVRLGPEEPIYGSQSSIDVGHGISLNITTSSTSRRDGFVLLRDVITRHRQWWTSQVLERYVRARWESTLQATGRRFHLMTEEKGKPPTLKQFARHAAPPARLWFGGDVSLLYGALAQKTSAKIERSKLLPREPLRFVALVFDALGGAPVERRVVVANNDEARVHADAQDRNHKLRRLASDSLDYVQLNEALGRAPTQKEFGSKFEWPSTVLAGRVDDAWSIFESAIRDALARASRI